MAIDARAVLAWLEALERVYAENRETLTALDAAIGDADHGANMDRGFSALKAELAAKPAQGIQALLQTAAAALIRHVGGASGPLYGTFFLRAAAACAGKERLEAADVAALFQAGVEGVRQRGKAVEGDKTMLDALLPAVSAMEQSAAIGGALAAVLQEGAAAARQGMEATVPLRARKGRASYLGERSIGHQDPGATSSWLLIDTAAKVWRE